MQIICLFDRVTSYFLGYKSNELYIEKDQIVHKAIIDFFDKINIIKYLISHIIPYAKNKVIDYNRKKGVKTLPMEF